MPDYDDRVAKPREQWIAWYFSWTESKDVTEAELHTARDGFDAGANWQSKPAQLLEAVRRLSEIERTDLLSRFCKGCARYLEVSEKCHCQNDE